MNELKVLTNPSEYDVLGESKSRDRTSEERPSKLQDLPVIPSIYIETDKEVIIKDLIMYIQGDQISLENKTCGQLVNILTASGINAYLTSSKLETTPAAMILNYSNYGVSRTQFFSGRIPKAALSIKHPENVVLSSDKEFKILSVFASNNIKLTSSDKKTEFTEDGQYFFLKEDYSNVSIAYYYFVSKFILFTCSQKQITSLPEDKKDLSLSISKKIISSTVDSTYANHKL